MPDELAAREQRLQASTAGSGLRRRTAADGGSASRPPSAAVSHGSMSRPTRDRAHFTAGAIVLCLALVPSVVVACWVLLGGGR